MLKLSGIILFMVERMMERVIESMFSTLSLPLGVMCLVISFVYLIFPHIGFRSVDSWSSYHRVFEGNKSRYAALTMFIIGVLPFLVPSLRESQYYPQFAVASIFAVAWFFTTSKSRL